MAGFSDGNEINRGEKHLNENSEANNETAYAANDEENFRIMAASDLHYLSPQLMDYSGEFRKMCEAIQEPEMERIEEITDALLENVFREKPDLFLITGDLSYQGEKLSHIRMAEKLGKLVRAGIRVYVVPGNQDVENPFSMCWRPEGEKGCTPAESVSAPEFQQIYRQMGYDENDGCIISRAPDSLSYQVRLDKQGKELHFFMLDTTVRQSPQGRIAPGTLVWLEERLKKMDDICLIAGHHPMLSDSPEREEYTLQNSRELCQLMWNYQVPFYISGHLHRAGAVQAPEPGNPLQKWVRRLAGSRRKKTPPVNIYLEKRGLHDLT